MPARVVLVAKPWRGGLSHYVWRALMEVFPGAVQWISTVPHGLREQLQYRRDRVAWRRRLVARLNRGDYDFGLFIGSFPELAELRSGRHDVLWINDHPEHQVAYADAFEAFYISDPEYRQAMETSAAGKRFAGVLPFAHSPDVHHPAPVGGRRHGVCFIANRDPKRDAPIAALLRSGLPVRIYGNYFLSHPLSWRYPQAFRPRVRNAAMARIYGAHLVSLNVHAEVIRGGTNMRTFECAGCGIAQVVEDRPGLEALFAPETEILVFHDLDEMLAQIRRLLRDRALAARLVTAARARALAEHTYRHRIETIRKDLGV